MGDWSHGLFACCEAPRLTAAVLACGCCYHEPVLISKVTRTPLTLCWVARLLECFAAFSFSTCILASVRQDLRRERRIAGSACGDCCAVVAARPLAVVQMLREIEMEGPEPIVAIPPGPDGEDQGPLEVAPP